MRISKITIHNFRSLREAEFVPTAFNVFVGQNNHGKTNFFEAMDWFYAAKGDPNELSFKKKGGEVRVEVEFTGVQEGITRMKNEKNKTVIQKFVGDSDTIRILRTSLDIKKRQLFEPDTGKWVEPGTGFDAALNDLLPKFEYVHTKLSLEDFTKYGKKTPIGMMLAGVLGVILTESKKYQDFKERFEELFGADDSEVKVKLDTLSGQVKVYLQKQFPDCTEVEFVVTQPEFDDLLKNFETSIDDGVFTDACEKGDGMQRALMLAIVQTYSDFRKENEEVGKSFLFFIDEGELHLHPTAQRKLKNALLDIAGQGDQVFLNTHSSVLVVDDHDGQTIFRVEKTDGETRVVPVGPAEKANIVYELLGGSPSDLLLPQNFLIVEGRSEMEFLSRVLPRFYSEKPRIQIVYAHGDIIQIERSMYAISQVIVPLHGSPVYKDRLVVMCDQAVEEKQKKALETFRSAYKDVAKDRLFVLSSGSIEELYPEPWKKTAAQVKELGKADGAKIALARNVGDGISQEQFEKEMAGVFAALSTCWSKAY